MKDMLDELLSLAKQDIYTDAPEYSERVDRIRFLVEAISPGGREGDDNRKIADKSALDQIQYLLDGSDWSADTFADVAELVRETGRNIEDTK